MIDSLDGLNEKQQAAIRWLAKHQNDEPFERSCVIAQTELSDGEYVGLLKYLDQRGHLHDILETDGGPYAEAFILKDTVTVEVNQLDSASRRDALEPQPPPLLGQLKWLWEHGWEYKWYVLVGAIVFILAVVIPLAAPSVLSGLFVHSENRLTAYDGIHITDVELLGSETGEYPYDNKTLYRFKIVGRYNIKLDRTEYGLLVFYKNLGETDQRDGWFVSARLDRRGFAVPNWSRLDELNPDKWVVFTSRVYLPSEAKPVIAFRAIVLPVKVIKDNQSEIADDKLGWGKDSLAYLTDLEEAYASEQIVFSAEESND